MKSLINVKVLVVFLISLTLIAVSISVFATDPLVYGSNGTTLSGNEYQNAQTPETENNTKTDLTNNTLNNTSNNVSNNTVNNAKTYNTNNKTDLPQTGIEDYNIGILLIICVISAIFAYKKINDYKNI